MEEKVNVVQLVLKLDRIERALEVEIARCQEILKCAPGNWGARMTLVTLEGIQRDALSQADGE